MKIIFKKNRNHYLKVKLEKGNNINKIPFNSNLFPLTIGERNQYIIKGFLQDTPKTPTKHQSQ